MSNSIQIVNRFFELMNEKVSVKALNDLISDDVKFIGPIDQANGRKEFLDLQERFQPVFGGLEVLQQSESNGDVHSVYELKLNLPNGKTLSMETAEWDKVEDGKITQQKIYFDTHKFMSAMAE